ncbi:TetR/AcrR family transcriptional regulator [Spirosoma linguale]|uniref:Transcriptional regulator, TetR family n=1 Tax=Spirosoma linguale (strain ATCC 33905 / DSM 74 / LMG 10896 / Claus 1) TaxID=504472 RepID=D2QN02_SPILD|nr:transcriptional regulator, TetR family [Spirosoma linguale DSM 74]
MKEKIISSALEQFLRFGIRKVTVQQIIYPLGLSTKAVYKYFGSKEELLENCLDVQYGNLLRQFKAIEARENNPIWILFKVYGKLMALDFETSPLFYNDLNRYYPDLQDKVIQIHFNKFILFFTNIVEAGKQQGFIQPTLHTPVFLVTQNALYRMLTRSDTYHPFKQSPFYTANYTIGVYLRGICTIKGIQEIDENEAALSFTNSKP